MRRNVIEVRLFNFSMSFIFVTDEVPRRHYVALSSAIGAISSAWICPEMIFEATAVEDVSAMEPTDPVVVNVFLQTDAAFLPGAFIVCRWLKHRLRNGHWRNKRRRR